jgi:hypothetical protein
MSLSQIVEQVQSTVPQRSQSDPDQLQPAPFAERWQTD